MLMVLILACRVHLSCKFILCVCLCVCARVCRAVSMMSGKQSCVRNILSVTWTYLLVRGLDT